MSKSNRGFTLIELMITVAIVGILAAIAYPSYIDQVRKSRRTDAKSLILQAANRQERFYTTEHRYADKMTALGMPARTENDWYDVAAAFRGGDNQRFQISATARGDQTEDTCVYYRVNELGQKTALDSSDADVSDTCW